MSKRLLSPVAESRVCSAVKNEDADTFLSGTIFDMSEADDCAVSKDPEKYELTEDEEENIVKKAKDFLEYLKKQEFQ